MSGTEWIIVAMIVFAIYIVARGGFLNCFLENQSPSNKYDHKDLRVVNHEVVPYEDACQYLQEQNPLNQRPIVTEPRPSDAVWNPQIHGLVYEVPNLAVDQNDVGVDIGSTVTPREAPKPEEWHLDAEPVVAPVFENPGFPIHPTVPVGSWARPISTGPSDAVPAALDDAANRKDTQERLLCPNKFTKHK
jgi:hypothetical protein